MNEELALINSCAAMLVKHFDKDIDTTHSLDLEKLREWLGEHIVYLMQYEMEKLLHILYRIDVDEKKVKAAFNQNDPKAIASIIAQLVIERELQKAKSRFDNKIK